MKLIDELLQKYQKGQRNGQSIKLAFPISSLSCNLTLRGSSDEVTYDSEGWEFERVTLSFCSECAAVHVSGNVYHTFIPHENGATIFEAKDRAYNAEKTEVFLNLKKDSCMLEKI